VLPYGKVAAEKTQLPEQVNKDETPKELPVPPAKERRAADNEPKPVTDTRVAIQNTQQHEQLEQVEPRKTQPVQSAAVSSADRELKRLTLEKSALEERKNTLEREIISIFGALAVNEAEISKAGKEVERERIK
jgi:predicted  nucleic acid-binding Zn-ribbon protein